MYNYSYEEYMNNLLGNYIPIKKNTLVNMSEPYVEENTFITYNSNENNKLEEYYPEIYKIIYPMIYKRCLYINEEITGELVEKITNEIYENIEQEEYPEETRSAQVNFNYSNRYSNRNLKYFTRSNRNNNDIVGKKQKNFLLNDLIKILVLRELVGPGIRILKPISFAKSDRQSIKTY